MLFSEVYRSPSLADCDQRAFVLKAVGIVYLIEKHEDYFSLVVPAERAAAALEHLRQYEMESVPPPPAPKIKLHGRAWLGSIVYALVVIAVAYCAGENVGGLDWVDIGALTRAALYDFEWWRAITALTLHVDVAHLIGNLVFGIPYGFFASQLLGPGRAWLSIIVAATCANMIDSAIMHEHQASIGASTAVFAMLGLVATYSWRKVPAQSKHWARRWAPVIAAVALLAFTGVGGEHTDVAAHVAGFFCGALLALAQSRFDRIATHGRVFQFVAGFVVVLAIVGAWIAAALSHTAT
jgi:rhomboid protease GluP